MIYQISKEKIGFVLLAILATLFMVLACDSQVRIAWTLYLIGLVLSALLGILFVLKIALKITPKIICTYNLFAVYIFKCFCLHISRVLFKLYMVSLCNSLKWD